MDEIVNEIEIALRDGLIDELITTTETGVDIIRRLTALVTQQEDAIKGWEIMASQLRDLVIEAVEQRDRARAVAVHLEDQCARCSNEVHHGPTY